LRFLPRFLGVWLIINGFAYMCTSLTALLLPHYEGAVRNFTFPLSPARWPSCCGSWSGAQRSVPWIPRLL